MRVNFGEWTPDLEAINVNGLTVAKNCVPGPDGYDPLNSLSSVTSALSGACLGAAWFSDKSGNVAVFSGDASKLYVLSSATWADKSKALGYTSATNWEFAQFGERIIATDKGQPVQYWDMGTSTAFADLPGSPPKASRMAIVGDFVVLGDLDIGGTSYPNWIAWSGFNASNLWAPNASTQADRQELFGRGGKVQAIVGGNVGVIFQEHAIRLMTFVGPPLIFRIDEVERSIGTPSPNSVVPVGGQIFYYGHDGFRVYSIGGTSTPISDNKVTRWFQDECDDVSAIRGVLDRQAQRILWAFPSGSSTNNRVIIYDWSIGKWSYGEVDTEILFEFATAGYTADTLDTLIPDVDTTTLPSFDSPYYQGGVISVAAFDTSHRTATFNGDPLTAVFETGEMLGPVRTFITKIRPLASDYGSMTVQIASRSTLASSASFGSVSTMNSLGEFTTRANARFHKFRLTISGGFTRAVGLDVDAKSEGNR